MLVHELMTSPATSVPAGSPLEIAVQTLSTRHISALPVVDAHSHVVGVISEADILEERLPADPRAQLRPVEDIVRPWHRLVDDVMTRPVTVHENSDVARVAELMVERGWKSLPVVRDGHLVGVISRSDVVRALSTPDVQIQSRVAHEFYRIGRDDWRVDVTEGVVSIHGPQPGRETRVARGIAETVQGVRRVVVDESTSS